MSNAPSEYLDVLAEDVLSALRRGEPLKFLESFDRLSAAYLRASGWSDQEIREVCAVALRTYLTGERTTLDLRSTVLGPRARQQWLTMGEYQKAGEVHLLWMQEKLAKWRHGSRIYRLHPATMAALVMSVDSDTVIPGDVLRVLPHPDAFVWLPAPITGAGITPVAGIAAIETYGGFFINGRTSENIGCHLDHADAVEVMIEFVGVAQAQNVVAPMSFRMNVPMDGNYSLESLGQRVVRNTDAWSDATLEEVVPLLRMAMAVLTYLASVGVDITDRRQRKQRRRSSSGAAPAPQQFDVGYRVGVALTVGRGPAKEEGNGEPHLTGRRVAAHIRRGHFHTYRHGEGKRLSKVKWLAPIAVNSHRNDPAGVVTVHRVGEATR